MPRCFYLSKRKLKKLAASILCLRRYLQHLEECLPRVDKLPQATECQYDLTLVSLFSLCHEFKAVKNWRRERDIGNAPFWNTSTG